MTEARAYLEVALLRGTNVRGHNTIKIPILLDTLRELPLPVNWHKGVQSVDKANEVAKLNEEVGFEG